MTPAFASNRSSARGPSASRPAAPAGWVQRAWEDASPLARRLAMAAALVALALLGAFYSVVSHAVGRAESGREQARVAAERQVICSAFSATSSRDLCLLTVAAHSARGAAQPVVQASYEPTAWSRSRPIVSARLD